jgi:uncharacterized protein (DUF427 family)
MILEILVSHGVPPKARLIVPKRNLPTNALELGHSTLGQKRWFDSILMQRLVFATESRKMAKASWGGKVLAESAATVVVEGNQYFPLDAVKKEFLKPSKHTTICPWKGTAHYYHLEVDGMKNENAAWFYPEPKPAAAEIKNFVAFWKGVRVEV